MLFNIFSYKAQFYNIQNLINFFFFKSQYFVFNWITHVNLMPSYPVSVPVLLPDVNQD